MLRWLHRMIVALFSRGTPLLDSTNVRVEEAIGYRDNASQVGLRVAPIDAVIEAYESEARDLDAKALAHLDKAIAGDPWSKDKALAARRDANGRRQLAADLRKRAGLTGAS